MSDAAPRPATYEDLIQSPSSTAHDRVTKAQRNRHDISHFWLVDPVQRILETFELTGEPRTRIGSSDDPVARIKPFDAIELRAGGLFPPLQGHQ
ncbi:MAG: hypothetical protein OXR73_36415 [Myxococcales bacterium]|nr:hypothetical protein [Myxococcales bacterium]